MSSTHIRDEPLIRNPAKRWLVIAAVWTGVASFFLLQGVVSSRLREMPIAPWMIRAELVYYWAWIPLTAIALYAARKFRFSRSTLWSTIAIHCAFALLIGVLHEFLLFVISTSLQDILPVTRPNAEIGSRVLQRAPYMISTTFYKYWAVIGIYLAFDYARKYHDRQLVTAELQTKLAHAELHALRMQLQPHFLFNTLHAVSMLNFSDVDAANRMLVQLSDLLRMSLDNSGRQTVSLNTELDFLSKYLQIEQTRFHDRLEVSYRIDDDLRDVEVPHLILQPLVENAIRHGIAKLTRGGRVDVIAKRDNGGILLSVCDNGPGLPHSFALDRASGIGLANTQARLEQTYGEPNLLTLANRPEGGVCAEVRIPQ
jgi:two-component system, LytTR family, sensor kinase